MENRNTPFRSLIALLAAVPFGAGPLAQTHVDPPPIEAIGANTDVYILPPTTNFYGTRGLSQTNSAEALGEGRIIFGFHGTGYQQQREFTGVPNKDARIFTGIGSAAWGMSPHMDLFAALAGYGSM